MNLVNFPIFTISFDNKYFIYLLYPTNGHNIHLVNIHQPDLCKILTGHKFPISWCKFSPNGKHIVSINGKEIIVWDYESESIKKKFDINFDVIDIHKFDFISDYKIAIICKRGNVMTFNLKRSKLKYIHTSTNIYVDTVVIQGEQYALVNKLDCAIRKKQLME